MQPTLTREKNNCLNKLAEMVIWTKTSHADQNVHIQKLMIKLRKSSCSLQIFKIVHIKSAFHLSFYDAFCYSQTSSCHISLVLTSCFRCEMAARWSDFKFPSQSWKHQWQRDDEPETLNNSQENIHSQNNKRDRKHIKRGRRRLETNCIFLISSLG